MKGLVRRLAVSVVLVTLILTGCATRVQEAPMIEQQTPVTPIEETSVAVVEHETSEEEETEAEEEAPEEEESEEDDPFAAFPKALADAGYDDIRTLIRGDVYAVKDGTVWSVVDKNDSTVVEGSFDHFATDEERYFSLTAVSGGEYVSRLYEYNPRTGYADVIYENDVYPDYDIVAVNAPYLMMATRTRSGEAAALPALYMEWEKYGDLDYEFYRLIQLTRNNVAQGGFDPDDWTGLSPFSDQITSIGGVFIDCAAYYFDPSVNAYYSIIGCNANNEILFSEDETDHAIEILPFVPTVDGYYVGYVIDVNTDQKTPAYGNVRSGIFSSEEMTAFPEEITDVRPYTGEDTSNGALVTVTDKDGRERTFDMAAGDYVTQ